MAYPASSRGIPRPSRSMRSREPRRMRRAGGPLPRFLPASAPQGMRQVSGLLPAQSAATGTDYPLAQPSATCLLGPRPESVKTGRDFTQATLLDWDMAALADVAELVVSELVTNALR